MADDKTQDKKPAKGAAEDAVAFDLPLYLDSAVHVRRNEQHHEIPGGRLVFETELTEDEVDELTARRVIRPATIAEIEAGRQRLAAKKAAAEKEAEKVAARTPAKK